MLGGDHFYRYHIVAEAIEIFIWPTAHQYPALASQHHRVSDGLTSRATTKNALYGLLCTSVCGSVAELAIFLVPYQFGPRGILFLPCPLFKL